MFVVDPNQRISWENLFNFENNGLEAKNKEEIIL